MRDIKNEMIMQMEYKIEIFRDMIDLLEGGDIRLDMPDINTSDIETIFTILSTFIDKTSYKVEYMQSDEYTRLETLLASIQDN